MTKKVESWCDSDEHHLFELYKDFNEWLDGDEGLAVREEYNLDGLSSNASKAFYVSDKAAYNQELVRYRKERYHDVLSKEYLSLHWYERNVTRFEHLVKLMSDKNVVPFIGAGLSVSGGFPTWENHLRQQGQTAGIDKTHIEELLSEGKYETVLEEIEERRGREVFTREIFDVFGRPVEPTSTTLLIIKLFADTLLTTNYDRLIEQAFETGTNKLQIITGNNAREESKADHITVVKLHGDVEHPHTCILSKNQYDEAYGHEEIDMSLAIPKLLEYYYKNSSLLFLGSSLYSDRTVQVFRAIRASLGDLKVPPHFSIEPAPNTEEELADRNEYLQRLGITAIWFEKGRYEYVENILELARNEVRYRGTTKHEQVAVEEVKAPCKIDLELSDFLHDLTELMPLMHWVHRHVPQKDTQRYLQSIQCLFYAGSFFTDESDKDLLTGIDNLARAVSNNPKYDGYTHEKLLTAFTSFQRYFRTIGVQQYTGTDWDMHELLAIPRTQFDHTELPVSDPNYHLCRLAVILLEHARDQKHSPKRYCELPEALNVEMNDYLTIILKEKLGLEIPDRLQTHDIHEIKELCKSAWDKQGEVYGESFLVKVRRCFGKNSGSGTKS